MTHYLRNNGKTIVDVETTKTDLHSVVVISHYSELLLSTHEDGADEFIADFHALQELRGEWHEGGREKETPREFVARRLRCIGLKWGLQYSTD